MTGRWPLASALLAVAVLLGLLWWAWQHVGLAALQLGLGAC
ncbi:hypothetical protein OX90_18025 [Pseudomonas coronafaciens pv. porri]|uniref:Uncharacterized protein n=1 Tax=Pseudomonas coronafaciens pv. porri TaxID=83964 RepID=A0ABR5JL73_9PSED|nr:MULTISPECIES: hypothetical protein [Pseudomonas syringae group]KOP55400.1 hypothetical protein OX88_13695 [Pseudomonas coronafaciens pv. porri]KOP55930.1 hypothetical protein OX90_18025 [Pseudomonas coronafaciens pv. porri]